MMITANDHNLSEKDFTKTFKKGSNITLGSNLVKRGCDLGVMLASVTPRNSSRYCTNSLFFYFLFYFSPFSMARLKYVSASSMPWVYDPKRFSSFFFRIHSISSGSSRIVIVGLCLDLDIDITYMHKMCKHLNIWVRYILYSNSLYCKWQRSSKREEMKEEKIYQNHLWGKPSFFGRQDGSSPIFPHSLSIT